MENPVKLKSIIEELEISSEDTYSFVNLQTGELIFTTSDNLRAAEDDEPFDHLPEWQQEDIQRAIEIIENEDNYIDLPTKYDINEYDMMEDFCLNVSDPQKQNALLNAIRGKGAFRRFKDKIFDFDIEEQWYTFRYQQYREIAIQWCKDNNIPYVE